MTILCVCTGNTCRSPMMERLLQREWPEFAVSSAGLATADGLPAAENAVAVMAERGIDLSDHRSRCLTPAMAEATDVFVVMTPQHAAALTACFGVDPGRILVPPGGIPDPYGGDLTVYRRCRDGLIAAIPALTEELNAR